MSNDKLADAAKALLAACDKSVFGDACIGLVVSKHDAAAVNAAIEALREALEAAPAPEPLTKAQIEAMPVWKPFVGLWPETRREITRAIERAHGIGIAASKGEKA